MEEHKVVSIAPGDLEFRVAHNLVVKVRVRVSWYAVPALLDNAGDRVIGMYKADNQGETLIEYAIAMLVDFCEDPPPNTERSLAHLGLWVARLIDADQAVFGARPSGIQIHLVGSGNEGGTVRASVVALDAEEARRS